MKAVIYCSVEHQNEFPHGGEASIEALFPAIQVQMITVHKV